MDPQKHKLLRTLFNMCFSVFSVRPYHYHLRATYLHPPLVPQYLRASDSSQRDPSGSPVRNLQWTLKWLQEQPKVHKACKALCVAPTPAPPGSPGSPSAPPALSADPSPRLGRLLNQGLPAPAPPPWPPLRFLITIWPGRTVCV